MTAVSFIRLVILATLLIASAARAEESAVSGTKVAPDMGGERQLELTHWRGTNALDVDGDAAQKIGYRSFGAQLHYAPNVVTLDLSGTNLLREIDDVRAGGRADKTTTIVTPSLGLRFTRELSARVSFSDIRTQVDNSLVDESYTLDTDRQAVGVVWENASHRATLTYATQARAEQRLKNGGLALSAPISDVTDRDYVPAQVDAVFARRIAPSLEFAGRARYSEYDREVYLDQDDATGPKSYAPAQLIDHRLSFGLDATYAATSSVALTAAFDRKAALDANSYTGDEYVVGQGATLGAKARFSEAATVSAAASTATGKKSRESAGERFEVSSRTTRFEASVALAM